MFLINTLIRRNKCFDFSDFLGKSKYYGDSNKLVVRKMRDETARVATEEVGGLKLKMYLFW